LLNILGGLDRPSSGEVYLDNVRIDNKDEQWWDSFRSDNLGFIYQDYNLLEDMTVRENIQLPLAIRNIEDDEKNKRVDNIINELGLFELLDKECGKLSGGQKQRVAIARALVMGARIILADEPTGNLDKENSENVFNLLKKIAKNHLVIVVTHDMKLACTYAERLIHISYGTVTTDKFPDEYFGRGNTVEKDKNVIFEKSITTVNQNRKLSLKDCLKFAEEAIRQRKLRCFISVMIFSITMLLILVLCETIFRKDSIPIAEYLGNKKQTIVPLYKSVPDQYVNLVRFSEISTGKKLYEQICKSVDESRIVRCKTGGDIELESNIITGVWSIYANSDNKDIFAYEGKFPEEGNEVAISKVVAEKWGISNEHLNSVIYVDGIEYTITAILTKVCGRPIEELFIADDDGDNLCKYVILLSEKNLQNTDEDGSMNMPGFGVTFHPNLYYQAKLYNDVGAVNDKLELTAGHMPGSDKEILISEKRLSEMNRTASDMVGKEYRLFDFYEKKYGCAYWNLLNLYDYMDESVIVVGVVNNDGDYYIAKSLYDKLYQDYMMHYKYSYYLITNGSTLENDMHEFLENDIKIYDSKLILVYDFMEQLELFRGILFFAVSTFSVLAVLLMISLYSCSINDCKKKIGILRTIGVRKADTNKIFAVESVVVFAFSYVFAVIANIFVIMFLNNFINKEIFGSDDINFLRMRVSVVALTGAISFVLSILSVLIPLRKHSKVKIIDLIK